ncbi:hypothetical protein ABZ398_37990, partial [Streptomyces sp. NPDC005890]
MRGGGHLALHRHELPERLLRVRLHRESGGQPLLRAVRRRGGVRCRLLLRAGRGGVRGAIGELRALSGLEHGRLGHLCGAGGVVGGDGYGGLLRCDGGGGRYGVGGRLSRGGRLGGLDRGLGCDGLGGLDGRGRSRVAYDEAASLIEEHHAAGRDVVIVSTSGAEVVEP